MENSCDFQALFMILFFLFIALAFSTHTIPIPNMKKSKGVTLTVLSTKKAEAI
jgi:hypothetical protein